MSPLSIGDWREIIGDWEKNKREREMKNQSAGVGFFNINPLYWEKVEREKGKINLLELLTCSVWRVENVFAGAFRIDGRDWCGKVSWASKNEDGGARRRLVAWAVLCSFPGLLGTHGIGGAVVGSCGGDLWQLAFRNSPNVTWEDVWT